MIHFVGAGSGAPDLITVRGQRLLQQADVIIYAGSLVNPALLDNAKEGCEIHDSAKMTLEQVISVISAAEAQGKTTVRLHTGDPSIYGAIREQMDLLDAAGFHYDVTPGVSSFCGAAAALKAEYTLPDVSQTVIITRMAGRTPVPEKEEISLLAAHGATMAIFLSTGMLEELRERLLKGGYTEDTPAAIVYKATWPDEKQVIGTIGTLPQMATSNGITKTALILVGGFLGDQYERSKLYDPAFTTEFREASV
ncbi:precorrin-4 C(11)-methyltransferase [Hydrogenoanaerobacterium sp.]|uniref:precorrin-4 C(11)-methyltransferase n=1 Tax=Hydrogenoanaerobacterium sp. TaxID=2953763 RepID=UPI0028A26612|nr:precorrin-4 C(11)-methyltransferase [Hydrogenoanaerobacterium sp.]